MKKLFFIALLLLTFGLNAQNHYLGIKAGANFSNISFSSEGSLFDFKTKTGAIAGLTYDYHFQKLLCIGAELSYEQRGNTTEILFTDEKLANILNNSGFKDCSFHREVLPDRDMWSGDNVTFCKTFK